MKLSRRLEAIYLYINDCDNVLDVGCDHAYLDIYLALNRKNKIIIASDISENVIKSAIGNIKKYKLEDKIKVYCTNGTNDIKDEYNTVVISGMGSHTILNILKSSKIVDKLIISSNNNWDVIRTEISQLGYFLVEEKLVDESNKLYSIMLFNKGYKNLSRKEKMIGKYSVNNRDLYHKYYLDIKNTYSKIPISKVLKKINYYLRLKYLKSYLRKENR